MNVLVDPNAHTARIDIDGLEAPIHRRKTHLFIWRDPNSTDSLMECVYISLARLRELSGLGVKYLYKHHAGILRTDAFHSLLVKKRTKAFISLKDLLFYKPSAAVSHFWNADTEMLDAMNIQLEAHIRSALSRHAPEIEKTLFPIQQQQKGSRWEPLWGEDKSPLELPNKPPKWVSGIISVIQNDHIKRQALVEYKESAEYKHAVAQCLRKRMQTIENDMEAYRKRRKTEIDQEMANYENTLKTFFLTKNKK